ncbi:sugar nucleotide-binding protein, partial [Streptomyces sp. ISL-21]|uniref:sugar nucleotide-binding protein n=1 Tax=Streptomyces sp. ISL-21 TaxID=2819179 RepID=UPI001BEC7B82
ASHTLLDQQQAVRCLPPPLHDHAPNTKKPLLIEQGLPLPQRTSVTNVGGSPILASRRPPQETTAPWIALDAADRDSCTRAIEGTHPDAIVLVHGPSDVTWCEDNPDRTTRVHTAAAINITTTAPGCRTVLISTDNVFNGRTWDNHEASAPDPTNAYGCAKTAG